MSYYIPEEYFSVFFFNKHFNEYFMQSRVNKHSCPDQTVFFFCCGILSYKVKRRENKKTKQQNILWQPYSWASNSKKGNY